MKRTRSLPVPSQRIKSETVWRERERQQGKERQGQRDRDREIKTESGREKKKQKETEHEWGEKSSDISYPENMS